jgi:hypothetical protein
MTLLPDGSVLVRTWFGGADADWEALVAAVRTPSDEGFLATVTVVDDPAFDGLDAEALTTAQADGAMVSFLADQTTLTAADHPILAVWTLAGDEEEDEDERDNPPFRVVPAELWSVENNINLANLDWDDFTAQLGPDQVYRGFD